MTSMTSRPLLSPAQVPPGCSEPSSDLPNSAFHLLHLAEVSSRLWAVDFRQGPVQSVLGEPGAGSGGRGRRDP